MAVWVDFFQRAWSKIFSKWGANYFSGQVRKIFLTMPFKKFFQKAMVKGGQTDLRNDRPKKVKRTALDASILAKRRKSGNRSGLRL
jgi:3-hydroxy-3-methylglutaryl CoA synthase